MAERDGWPPEIDIWEHFGTFFDPDASWGGFDKMFMRYIHAGDDPQKPWRNTHSWNAYLPDYVDGTQYNGDESHVYGFLWSQTKMEWYIDGVQVHEIERGVSRLSANGPTHNPDHWPEEDMHFILNNAVMSNRPDMWPKTLAPDDPGAYSNILEIDYMAAYLVDA